ncbi:retrovirus-related pol polyprotein from transposon TNT 1-94 [Tanacetum coccineum]
MVTETIVYHLFDDELEFSRCSVSHLDEDFVKRLRSTYTSSQETPGDLTTGDRLSPKVKVFLILVIVGFQLNVEQADWRDDTDDEPGDQELEAYYMYMAQIQEVTPDAADNSGPIFDTEPLQKVHNDDDNYNVFANDREHPEQPESVNNTYLEEQGDTNITIDSLDMSTNGETVDQDDNDLTRERELLASLIEKLKCEIDDSKNQANNELSKTNQLMFKDLKKFQAELDRYHDVNYASKVAIDCAKAKGDLMSYKMETEKSFNEYTRKINDLNQTISKMKKELFIHHETISIMSQEKEAQKKFHKTREDKELEKFIALENKIKVLDDIVYKTGHLVQTMNMFNRNCKTSFVKPEFLKKAQRTNPLLYDIGCYNDNLALMLAPQSDETIRLAQESRSKLSDLIRPFDYKNLNNLYDLFVPQREKSPEHRYFLERTKMPMAVPISTREHKRTVNQSVATPLKRTVASGSTNQKPRHTTRKLYEHVSKTCSWWYPKFTPSGYKWKPKSPIGNVNTNLIEIILFIVDSGCSKHMTGNLKLLSNFVEKFLGTVKFGNDQIALILGYGDLVQENITIKRVYYVEGLNHNLFSVGQFCDANLEVAFRKSTCYVRDLKGNDLLTDETPEVLIDFLKLVQRGLNAQVRTVQTDKGTKFLNKTLHAYFAQEGIEHQTSTARTPEQNGIVERRNRTLVEVARTMLSAAKVPLFIWAEAIATTCFTQNRSLVIPRHEKTPYHIINGRKPSVKFFHIFGSLCYIVMDGENLDKMVYNKRTRVIVETIHVNFDELPQMASDHVSSDPVPQCPTTELEHDSLSLGPQSQENVHHSAKTVTTLNELDLLFSPMFDELLNGTTPVVSKTSAVTATDAPNQRQQQHTTPSTSTTVAADTPPLNIQTTPETTSQAPTQVPTVTANENIIQAETNKEYAQVEEEEFINIFSTPVQERGETSSRHVDSSNMHTFYQRHPSEHHWTKDHPLKQVIGNPSQSIRIRRQLETDGEICMFALTVSRTKPKNIKEAMADSAWIEAMQEELHQFDRLDV